MGLYDRDYTRFGDRSPWDRVENPRSMVITLIVINAVIFLADIAFAKRDPQTGYSFSVLADWFALHTDTLIKPWTWWQLLTYGFLHDISDIWHVAFNMFGLFIFGRPVERRIGGKEFLRFYLLALVIGGIIGSAYGLLIDPFSTTRGASGAVVAVTILFACYYPNVEVLLMFVFPVKAWVLAVGFVLLDLAGALGITGDSSTAFQVHLAGAAFALAYYSQNWKLNWLDFSAAGDLPGRFRQRSRRMKLKLHDPDKKLAKEESEADRILAKIYEQGEESLTPSERKTLERYSRRKRQGRDS